MSSAMSVCSIFFSSRSLPTCDGEEQDGQGRADHKRRKQTLAHLLEHALYLRGQNRRRSGRARAPCERERRTHLARELTAKVLDVLVDTRAHTAVR